MGLFSKREAAVDAASPKKASVKGGLADIISESVAEHALEAFRKNTRFVVHRDGEELYVGIIVDTNSEKFGGLTKKLANKNEAKGNIVQLINGGTMSVYMSDEMLTEGKLLFIPDSVTLSAMSEYSLLSDADFTLAFVNVDGEIEQTTCLVTHEELVGLHTRDASESQVMEFLAIHGVDWADVDTGEDFFSNANADDYDGYQDNGEDNDDPFGGSDSEYGGSDDVDDVDEDDEDVTAGGDFVGHQGDDEQSESYGYDTPQEDYGGDEFDEFDESEDMAVDDAEISPDDRVFTDSDVQQAVCRKFYSDDLGLEVTTEPFEMQFGNQPTYAVFDEQRGDGWLNGYLSQISKEANREMRNVHQRNITRLRQMYIELMSLHCKEIQTRLDLNNPKTDFGGIYADLQKLQEQRKASIDEIVAQRKSEVMAKWEASLAKVREDAANRAAADYSSRYRAAHEDELSRLRGKVIQEIETECRMGYQDMHTQRRSDASRLLDLGVTAALQEVNTQYQACIEEEGRIYKTWQDKVNQYLEDNRQEDIAHTEIMRKELAQTQRVEQLMAEHTQELESRSAMFEAERQRLMAEIAEIERQSRQRVESMQHTCDETVAGMQRHNDDLRDQLNVMMDKYANLDKQKDDAYRQQMDALKGQNEALSIRNDTLATSSKRFGGMAVAVGILGAVAAFAIGVLAGTVMPLSTKSDDMQNAIVQEFNDRMDAMLQEYETTDSGSAE